MRGDLLLAIHVNNRTLKALLEIVPDGAADVMPANAVVRWLADEFPPAVLGTIAKNPNVIPRCSGWMPTLDLKDRSHNTMKY